MKAFTFKSKEDYTKSCTSQAIETLIESKTIKQSLLSKIGNGFLGLFKWSFKHINIFTIITCTIYKYNLTITCGLGWFLKKSHKKCRPLKIIFRQT
jgi:hypothetical protein